MKQLVPALFAVGALMALVGAAVFITGWIYAPYIYTIGAGFVALAQINTPVKGKSKTLKRLRIQQIFGAVALVLTGAFMFSTRGNEWIACLTIAAILELYTAFRIRHFFIYLGACLNFTQYYFERKIQTDPSMFDIKIYPGFPSFQDLITTTRKSSNHKYQVFL